MNRLLKAYGLVSAIGCHIAIWDNATQATFFHPSEVFAGTVALMVVLSLTVVGVHSLATQRGND